MSMPCFFGYGSLVNRATHDYRAPMPARISGWRRVWRHVEGRTVAFLTVTPCTDTEIEGLVAAVPGGDWAALDLRERNYNRVPAHRVIHAISPEPDIHIYYAPPELHCPATRSHPILLSYLDVVVQGYLAEFGKAGVAQFFDTTDGWDAPILNDREDPIYPRHQALCEAETALIDTHLKALGVDIIQDRPADYRR